MKIVPCFVTLWCRQSAGKEMVYRRFYLTLLLYHLLKERSVWDVASMFSCSRGFVQNLMTSAASFASCLLNFTEVRHFFLGVLMYVCTAVALFLRIYSSDISASPACVMFYSCPFRYVGVQNGVVFCFKCAWVSN